MGMQRWEFTASPVPFCVGQCYLCFGLLGFGVMRNEDQARSLFGISLNERPKWQQFLICSSGFFFGYLVNGVCEVGFFSFSKIAGNYLFCMFMLVSNTKIGVCVMFFLLKVCDCFFVLCLFVGLLMRHFFFFFCETRLSLFGYWNKFVKMIQPGISNLRSHVLFVYERDEKSKWFTVLFCLSGLLMEVNVRWSLYFSSSMYDTCHATKKWSWFLLLWNLMHLQFLHYDIIFIGGFFLHVQITCFFFGVLFCCSWVYMLTSYDGGPLFLWGLTC